MSIYYKNKYLKYKNKYLNLVNQLGGNDTMFIYTTGLAHYINNSFDLLNTWYNCRFNHIVNQIPITYKNIIIYHYDPMLFVDNNEKENYIHIIKDILNNINKNDNDDRNYKQHFINKNLDYININKNLPYIILDFANLFKYNFNKSDNTLYLTYGNHYNEGLNENTKFDLNCIYVPYSSTCNSIWEKIKYFEYNNNKFKSYIQVFLERFKNYEMIFDDYEIKIDNDIIIVNRLNFIIDKIINNTLIYKQLYPLIRDKFGYINDIWLNDNKIIEKIYISFFNKMFASIDHITNDHLLNLGNYEPIMILLYS
jgi:hypothetical protein